MEFRDLKKQYEVLKPEMDKAMLSAIESGHFIMGKEVGELEKSLGEFVGVKHCITCANGTDALYLAMMAWDIKEGDCVFVPDFTFFSSAEIVAHAGGTPIFVDVDPQTFNLDPAKLEVAIERCKSEGKYNPRAIVAVDLFGLPADLVAIRKIADKHGLLLLEDGAQGFGGNIDGKRACSFGDIGTTSFFPAKPLGCYGDGGAVFTDSDEVADLIKSLRVHGKGATKYDNVRIGLNSRLDTVQAAVLQVKLKAFEDRELEDVNNVAIRYTKLLDGVVETPYIPEGFYSSWAQYTIKLQNKEERDALKEFLATKKIPSMIYYQKQMHLMDAFDKNIYSHENFEVSNALVDRVLSLPMHPYMREEDIVQVAEAIKEFVKNQ